MSYRYPLATSSWDDAEYSAMREVIASERFTMGAYVEKFEAQFAEYMGARRCVMVNSGSSANMLMIGALFCTSNPRLRMHRGDEVIVPAVSWSTTYSPLYLYGLKMRFVDVDLATLNYDLAKLADAVTDRTRMIMAVNLLGNPNDFTAIQKIIAGRGIVVIEDNCESMGAEFGNKKAGTFGVMGSSSFFFSHHISTMEGGGVVTDDEELYQIMHSLRAHGWTRGLPNNNLVSGAKMADPFDELYRFVLPGYNFRPLELSGAIGIEQVKKLPSIISNRRENGKLLQEVMAGHSKIIIQKETGSSSWFGFSLIPRPGAGLTRKDMVDRLTEAGFESRPIVAGNFAKNEVVAKYFDHEIAGSLENAEHVDKCGCFVGNNHYPMPDAIEKLSTLWG